MPSSFRFPRTVARVLLVAVVLALAACGGTASPAPASGAPASAAPASAAASPVTGGGSAGGTAVTIEGFAFSPATLTVSAGTTVTWTNRDSAPHTATADDSSFDSKPLDTGATFSQTFATAGTFSYHCAIHPRMTGTVVVN